MDKISFFYIMYLTLFSYLIFYVVFYLFFLRPIFYENFIRFSWKCYLFYRTRLYFETIKKTLVLLEVSWILFRGNRRIALWYLKKENLPNNVISFYIKSLKFLPRLGKEKWYYCGVSKGWQPRGLKLLIHVIRLGQIKDYYYSYFGWMKFIRIKKK